MALTYEDLLSLYRAEKGTNALAGLPEGFDESLRQLLLQTKERAAIETNGIKLLENARRASIALLSLRRQKILLRAIANEGKVDEATDRENRFYSSVKKICNEEDAWIDEMAAARGKSAYMKNEEEKDAGKSFASGGGLGKESENGEINSVFAKEGEKKDNSKNNDNKAKSFKKVRILKDITDAYRGADGESYGPFKAGQSVELPEAEAKWVINKGMGIAESNNGQGENSDPNVMYVTKAVRLKKVKIEMDVPVYENPDGQSFGPFDKGQEVSLPEPEARHLARTKLGIVLD